MSPLWTSCDITSWILTVLNLHRSTAEDGRRAPRYSPDSLILLHDGKARQQTPEGLPALLQLQGEPLQPSAPQRQPRPRQAQHLRHPQEAPRGQTQRLHPPLQRLHLRCLHQDSGVPALQRPGGQVPTRSGDSHPGLPDDLHHPEHEPEHDRHLQLHRHDPRATYPAGRRLGLGHAGEAQQEPQDPDRGSGSAPAGARAGRGGRRQWCRQRDPADGPAREQQQDQLREAGGLLHLRREGLLRPFPVPRQEERQGEHLRRPEQQLRRRHREVQQHRPGVYRELLQGLQVPAHPVGHDAGHRQQEGGRLPDTHDQVQLDAAPHSRSLC